MTLTEGKGPVTSSYIDSMCVLLPAVFDSCRSRAALIFALLLKMMTITVMKTTMLTIKTVTKELMDTIHTVLISVEMSVFILNELLMLPVIFPQTTICTASTHMLAVVGTSVQVTLMWLVVVGQLPQFDARML